MSKYNSSNYVTVKQWLSYRHEKGKGWDELMLACKGSVSLLENFLEMRMEEDEWPSMTVEEWQKLVTQMKEEEKLENFIDIQHGAATIHDDSEDNAVSVPQDSHSSWQTYKKGLLKKGFKADSIREMERSTLKVLKRLSSDTIAKKPVKGLVVGNVQSGKTANMAALMAMAADWGWNMFVILSGTIDNLRKQTQSRLFEDLNQPSCRLNWRSLDHLKKKMSVGNRAQDMHFESGSMHRYFCVSLKNKSRLKDLIQWLQYSPSSQEQMKVLVIDDESDLAGINTANVTFNERTQINRLICSLVNGLTEKQQPCEGRFCAMNYIGYTATPYANVLNEAGEESLYPRSFITSLGVSNEYFGPQQIFGYDGSDFDGVDVIRKIPLEEIETLKQIHDGEQLAIPHEFEHALCWFLCGVSCMRLWGYSKPISMLVHTSLRTLHHDYVAKAIESWISGKTERTILNACKKVWNYETKQLSKKKFFEQYPTYGRAKDEVNDYPKFESLVPYLLDLLSKNRISFIKLGEDKVLKYHSGLHLCIDNCRNNTTDGEWYLRLAYPEKDKMPSPAPAFIVVGGSTLSRGLTIEGLIATYFLRTVGQADTLMQMGRWFGYRRGYELIPRIWLTERTQNQFGFLSSLDQELRDEIHEMEVLGKSPAHYGPRVKNSPRMSFIRITGSKRMQQAQPTDMDFSGIFKQTFLFDNNKNVIINNLKLTTDFIHDLGLPSDIVSKQKSAVIWLNVHWDKIKAFLVSYQFHERLGVFNDIVPLTEWISKAYKEGNLGDWNVILSSRNPVIRTRKQRKDNGIIDIGALRNPADLLADIDLRNVSEELKSDINKGQSRFANDIRRLAGIGNVPQLIIYIIDKDSKASPDSEIREDLNAPANIAGLCINIPGNSNRNNTVATISIHMPSEDLFNDNGDIDGATED